MRFCENCGSQLPDDAAFCTQCGAPCQAQAEPSAPAEDPSWTAPEPPAPPAGEDWTAPAGDPSAEGHKLMATLAYFGILVLVPLLGDRQSTYSRFHANQGLVLLVAEVLVWGGISVAAIGGAALLGTIFSFAQMGLVGLSVVGIIHAATGQRKEVPVLGKFRILK